MGTTPVSPLELLTRLEAEHRDGYVYRGESRAFPPPMWPSRYRRFFSSENPLEVEPENTVRHCGRKFYFRLNVLRNVADADEEKVKQFCMTFIRNALGYPLSEALFQQAGWTSEGIDVTYDPRVAFVFALSTWTAEGAVLESRPEPAVIYRIPVTQARWTFDDLRNVNFFSCPTFIPTREICRLFKKGSKERFKESLAEYQRAIKWDLLEFDLEAMQGTRPFELIRLPLQWSRRSRIELQSAALLLPDAIPLAAHQELRLRSDLGMMQPGLAREGEQVPVTEVLHGGSWVEDVSARDGVERFEVDVSSRGLVEEIAPSLNTKILPPADSLFDLLENWIWPYFRVPMSFGTMPIDFFRFGVTPQMIFRVLRGERPERRFSR